MEEKDIDKLLREKANSIDDNKYNYKVNVDEIKLKANMKKKGVILKISFVSAICACLILFMLVINYVKNIYVEDNVKIQAENNYESFKPEDIVKSIILKDKKKETEEMIDLIIVAKVTKYEPLGIVSNIPTTKITAEIKQIEYKSDYIGELDNEIEFTLNSLVMKISDLPDNLKSEIDEQISSEKYVKIVSNKELIDVPYPEIDKEYIITLLSLDDNNFKVINNAKYSFYEYDENTKKVKIGNEWQDIDYKYVVW